MRAFIALLLSFAIGCAIVPKQRSIQVSVSRVLSAGNADYFRYLETALVSTKATSPDAVWKSLRPANTFASGQYGAREAMLAEQEFRRLFRANYHGNPDELKIITAGIHEALVIR